MTAEPSVFPDGILQPEEFVAEKVYEIDEYLGGGNSGEVYRIKNPNHGRNRIIKLFIPFYELRQAQLGEQEHGEITNQIIENAKNQPYQRREYRFLANIDHPFIVKVHDFGVETLSPNQLKRLRIRTGDSFSGTDASLTYIIASYVEGKDLGIALPTLGRAGLLRSIHCVAEALDYLHTRHEYLHLDVKPANVRVRTDGYAILVDFALSQDLSEPFDSEPVKGGIDWDLTPFRHGTSGIATIVEGAQSGGLSRQEFKAQLFPWLDQFQFGLLLKTMRKVTSAVLTPAEAAYFDRIVALLCDWDTVTKFSAGELGSMVERIDATKFFLAIRPGSMSGGKEVPLSNGRTTFVPPSFIPLVEHPELTRLNRLNQLSLLPARFCGATHSRYEHSIDTFRIGQSIARRLLDVPECRMLFEEQDIDALLAACLLHDVNHVPLTHLYQESSLPVLRTIDLFKLAFDTKHGMTGSLGEDIARHTNLDPSRLLRLVAGDWTTQAGPRRDTDQVISSVINSGVDVDKLSYLPMDSQRSGLGFAAGVDTTGLMRYATLVTWTERSDGGLVQASGYHLAFREEALGLIEAVVTARSRGFHELYWCADNRAMMALFLSCVRGIASAPDGPNSLATLLVDCRGETDYAILQRLDALSEGLCGRSWQLATLFDSVGDTQPTLVYSSEEPYDEIRRLAAYERGIFEDRVLAELAPTLPSLAAPNRQLMLDVPDRNLGLGGRILIADRFGQATSALQLSKIIQAQQERLKTLTQKARLYLPGAALPEWAALAERLGGEEQRQLWLSDVIKTALGGSSFR